MSSRSIKKKFVKIEYTGEKEYFDLKRIVIPFSLFFIKEEKCIYDENEKMPFSRRVPLFKAIFMHEFSDGIRNTKNKT